MQAYLGNFLSTRDVRIFGQSVYLTLACVVKETFIPNILIGVLLLYTIPAVALLMKSQV